MIRALLRSASGGWLRFADPVRVLTAERPADVDPLLREVERAAREEKYHAVGYLAYEAGAAYGLPVAPPPAGELPLAWFGLFAGSEITPPGPAAAGYDVADLRPSIDRAAFRRAFDRIKRHLADGDTYQVNFTFELCGRFTGDPEALFADLVAAQRGRYPAFLHLGSHAICSASPELFFSLRDGRLEARPMKGTAPRGRTPAEDRDARRRLRTSTKQQAENVMIVDMVRNDIGRISATGSVSVPQLFAVERYPTVWQMTSLVTGDTTAGLPALFAALHPSASVTGAPKRRTMDIVRSLEGGPRGVYTGAIGHVAPDGSACFNVAIRTAVVDIGAGSIRFGVGSGIVWDSDPEEEYAECLLKGAVLGRRPAAFELLETMRWTPRERFFLLERHLNRLRDSAGYFGFPYDRSRIEAALDAALEGASEPQRVRLLVSPEGGARVERAPLPARAEPLLVAPALEPVDASDPFLFHKTTRREVYDWSRRPGFHDTLLWNREGHVTECTTANVVADLGGTLVTPAVRCGLLAGTFRAALLDRGEIEEGVLRLDDVCRARRMWLINSVFEWREARIETAPA